MPNLAHRVKHGKSGTDKWCYLGWICHRGDGCELLLPHGESHTHLTLSVMPMICQGPRPFGNVHVASAADSMTTWIRHCEVSGCFRLIGEARANWVQGDIGRNVDYVKREKKKIKKIKAFVCNSSPETTLVPCHHPWVSSICSPPLERTTSSSTAMIPTTISCPGFRKNRSLTRSNPLFLTHASG